MPRTGFIRIALAALVLGMLLPFSALAKKVYTEPNAQVTECANQCNVVKMSCRAHARDQHQYCKAIYQQQVRQYQWCRQSNGSFCQKPDRCPVFQTRACSNNYDACFESCGGIIEDSKDIKRRQKEEAARAAAKDDDPGS
ncbi:MAG: hypothetical protein AAGA23_08510 [Pseudomonadota bacterium]